MHRHMRQKGGRPLKPDERDLWRRYTKTVSPLRTDLPTDYFAPPQMAALDGSAAKGKSALKSSTRAVMMPPVLPRKPSAPPQNRMGYAGLDGATQRRLRRGRAQVDATLDLHGMRQAEAHVALNTFVLRAKDRGHRCILIITGKGTRIGGAMGAARANPYEAQEPGVLRTRLRQWLAQEPLRGLVFGIEEAHPRHGGSGAFYVFIRKKG